MDKPNYFFEGFKILLTVGLTSTATWYLTTQRFAKDTEQYHTDMTMKDGEISRLKQEILEMKRGSRTIRQVDLDIKNLQELLEVELDQIRAQMAEKRKAILARHAGAGFKSGVVNYAIEQTKEEEERQKKEAQRQTNYKIELLREERKTLQK